MQIDLTRELPLTPPRYIPDPDEEYPTPGPGSTSEAATGTAGAEGVAEPSTPGTKLAQAPSITPAPGSTFALRHRGHTRTTSNADSVQSALDKA